MKYLGTIESLRKQLERNRFESELEMDDIKLKCELKENYVEKDRGEFVRVKRDTGVHSVSAQTGRPLTLKEVEFYLERQASKEREVIGVRIENIRLKNQLAKREHELKSREEFGDGLHMIDFEQLKIENQTYNEKIEERNEELMKLKKKLNNTVQILSHVKEKLKFVNDENEKEKVNLSVNDELVKKVHPHFLSFQIIVIYINIVVNLINGHSICAFFSLFSFDKWSKMTHHSIKGNAIRQYIPSLHPMLTIGLGEP